ncbi:hypothetical protein HD806DRAFT_517006 [Xylariaceae sp. AK1471]|nr:hypothetical protein HD806DRAFT_517006 [Xylariaceae sp. AK1471]
MILSLPDITLIYHPGTLHITGYFLTLTTKMSGIEVVGIVLGTIPLVISALEHYQNGRKAVSTWRRHLRVTQSLMRNLKTEHGKLYNTCETLLGGIVPSAMLLPMLKEPFGTLWQDEDVKERIERRLDHMYAVFEDNVKDMLATMEELKSSLGLGAHTEVGSSTGSSIKRNLMKASLVINRSSYDEALQNLISKNQTLETIVVGSLRLEPSRRKRSQGIFFELFQRIVGSVYRALQSGLCDACPQKHEVNLQLSSPRLGIRSEDESSIIGKMNFRVIISHIASELSGACYSNRAWTEVRLQVAALQVASTLPKGITSSPEVSSAGQKPAKRVKFSMNQDLHTNNDNQPKTIDPKLLALTSVPGTEGLCRAVLAAKERSNSNLYAMDPSNQKYGRFGVHPLHDSRAPIGLSFASIRDAMQHPLSRPSLPQKLALASTIAAGVLQLHNTPWLSNILTNRDIYFALRNDLADFNQIFVNKTLHNETQRDALRTSGFGNELIWALFMLLIEVILWRPVDDALSGGRLDPEHSVAALPSRLFDYTSEEGFAKVQEILSRVTMAGGVEYRSAVECCLKLAFGYVNLDLGKEEFRQQIYENVILPIEESAEKSRTLVVIAGGLDNIY